MKKIREIISGTVEPNIFPFLWIHGETEDVYVREIERIYQSGIRSVCIEARPHRDFNGEGWFQDLSILLRECKKRGMELWLLDDSHFPTGYANGAVKEHFPQLQKQYLCLKTLDFMGPMENSGAILTRMIHSPDDTILGVYLQKRTGFEQVDVEQTIDVTDRLAWIEDYHTGRPNHDLLGNPIPGVGGKSLIADFDLPEGAWSLQVLSVSCYGGEKQTEGYLNPIVPEATDILLQTVYQPIYEHFKDEFGKAFRGFFSDEPRFGNIHGSENASIGRNSGMVLPWRPDLDVLLLDQCREHGGVLSELDHTRLLHALPLLFAGDGELAHALRYVYMDLVSQLYSEHFDGRIAAWCHAHGCERIGHTIEDNEAAARLGYGAGHIFRAMEHSDMAGVDVVMHQLTPGFDSGLFKGKHSPGWDGEFFTYLLGKFGGSLAHLDPKKKGRAMCELFGAYGWAEGNRLMKWLADYMMVNGVNHLVPHAFDAAPFPNSDCPPHFCGEGHNPQYPEFRILMDYCGRLCSMLSGGYNITPIALYFNAEGEWSGDYQSTAKPAAELGRSQIDYDLVSMDYLLQGHISDGELVIHTERFKALVLPYAQALPQQLLARLINYAAEGLSIYFVAALPQKTSEGGSVPAGLTENGRITVVTPGTLAEVLWKNGHYELKTSVAVPNLHYYHYRQEDGDLYFFTNQDAYHDVETKIAGIKPGQAYCYDPFSNTVTLESEPAMLRLPPSGSKLLLIPDRPIEEAKEAAVFSPEEKLALGDCQVFLAPMEALREGEAISFEKALKMSAPDYISKRPEYVSFSGRLQYRFQVELTKNQAEKELMLFLCGVREGAKVIWNGQNQGTKIVPEYRYPLNGSRAGINELTVELNTTLGRTMNDFLSQFLPMEPVGMSGAYIAIGHMEKYN